MSKTKIEWADYTFNPWIGCTKVSQGCKFCYAERLNKLYLWNPAGWGTGAARKRASKSSWQNPVQLNKCHWVECTDCHWRGDIDDAQVSLVGRQCYPKCECGHPSKPARIRLFCASLADVFDEEVPQEWREDLWKLIEATPNLDWLILTKRPENIDKMLPDRWSYWGHWELFEEIPDQPPMPRNIWMGISAEDQEQFESRWPVLEWVGRFWYISKLFISAEPLLGPIDMADWLTETVEHEEDNMLWTRGIDWVIVGGESGPEARPMHLEWARKLRDQCVDNGVPFFFKQWGEWVCTPPELEEEKIGIGLDKAYIFWRAGKKKAGRLLDGREWNEYPDSEWNSDYSPP